jgi:heptosyltransferase-1
VIDLQGLTKSALVSRLARLTPAGVRIAMANRTEGSSYEAPTRWVAHRGVRVRPHIHAVERARVVCAQALGYDLSGEGSLGLSVQAQQTPSNEVVCVHGTSREDKRWPEAHWLALGHHLLQQGQVPVFVHGNADELARSHRLASALPGSQVWPSLRLDELAQRMVSTQGVIGVDSGVSHIAVALGLPHVQIYNFDTAWRTGPVHAAHQLSVFAQPCPSVQAVWQAWLQVKQQAPHPAQDQDQDREHTA